MLSILIRFIFSRLARLHCCACVALGRPGGGLTPGEQDLIAGGYSHLAIESVSFRLDVTYEEARDRIYRWLAP